MRPNASPKTDEFLRENISPMIMLFYTLRQKFADETVTNIFDMHSSTVDPGLEIRKVCDKTLKDGLCIVQEGRDGHVARDWDTEGCDKLQSADKVVKCRRRVAKAWSVKGKRGPLDEEERFERAPLAEERTQVFPNSDASDDWLRVPE
jgi:hypothetical protein